MRHPLLKFLLFSALLLTLNVKVRATGMAGRASAGQQDKGTQVKAPDHQADLEADLTRSFQSPIFKNLLPDGLITAQVTFAFAEAFRESAIPKVYYSSALKHFYRLLLFPFHVFW